jgi:hypothetical protein
MLPPYIIEEIRRREEQRRRREIWPSVELPMEPPQPGSVPPNPPVDPGKDREEESTQVDYRI